MWNRIISIFSKSRAQVTAAGFIFLLNLILFYLNLSDFFVSDDFDWLNIVRNGQASWIQILTGNYYGLHGAGGSFRPMVNLIFSVENFFFGLNPFGYHLISVLLHAGCAFLVYLIALKLFAGRKFSSHLALFSGLVFSLMPNHAEAVIWIAAVGDPLATFFYLLSFYCYLKIKNDESRIKNLFPSLIFFILALLTKETAITLPFLILGYEIIFRKASALKPLTLNLKVIGSWFLILGSYLIYRYWAIGLGFGYYGRTSLINVAHIKEYARTLINLDVNTIVYGPWRIAISGWIFEHWYFYAAAFAVVIAWSAVSLFKNKNRNFVFLIYFWLLNVGLVLPLSLGLHNDEGARYGYLPSVSAALLIAWLIMAVYERQKHLASMLFIFLSLYFIYNLNLQGQNWSRAALISQKIYHQLADFNYQQPAKTFIIGLPDNYHGAQVMRNGVLQALQLQGKIDLRDQIERIPVYIVLDDFHFSNNIFDRIDGFPDGYLFHSLNEDYIFTGNATETHPDYKFELWGYDYSRVLSNKVRLMFVGERLKDFKAGRLQILYFDEGDLKRL